MKAHTVKQVNLAIEKAGMLEITLYKGDGYFYFMGVNCDDSQGGVYVNSLHQLTLAQWLEEAKSRYCKKEK
jgi:hypothetical protein